MYQVVYVGPIGRMKAASFLFKAEAKEYALKIWDDRNPNITVEVVNEQTGRLVGEVLHAPNGVNAEWIEITTPTRRAVL